MSVYNYYSGRVTILGRPNVGKSSLFNRLIGRKVAIVHDRRGVTRDIISETIEYQNIKLILRDSGGLEETLDKSSLIRNNLSNTISSRQLLEVAINDSDLIILVIDGKKGITAGDKEITDWLRRFNCSTIVVINKVETNIDEKIAEGYFLGFKDIIPVSATHNTGINTLLQKIHAHIIKTLPIINLTSENKQNSNMTVTSRNLTVLGQPNVGKSTLINALLGTPCSITGSMPGLTRDTNNWTWSAASDNCQHWSLVDTAGLKPHGKYEDSLDRLTAKSTWQAIRMSNIIALVIDATTNLTRNDLNIAKDCARLGRPMILIVNKIDLINDLNILHKQLHHQLTYHLAQLRHLPYLFITAKYKKGIEKIVSLVRYQDQCAARRISTSILNKWLKSMIIAHSPPLINKKRLKIKYITQIEVSPPKFVLFSSQKSNIPKVYLRYLRNGLVDSFNFNGIPLKLEVRASINPFDILYKKNHNRSMFIKT